MQDIWSQGNVPNVCLVLNHPDTLFALGYTAPSNGTLTPAGFGNPMLSTDDGSTLANLPSLFLGNDTANLSCSADASAGQNELSVDPYDSTGTADHWQTFGITAN